MAAREGVFNEGGRGRKQCPNCEKFVGSRNDVCPNCGKAIPAKSKAGGTKKKGSAKPDPFVVIESVKAFGGVGEVKKQLAAVAKLREQADAIDEKLKALGGIDGAEESLALMESLEAALKAK